MGERGDADPKDIDLAMTLGAGQPLGPHQIADFIGKLSDYVPELISNLFRPRHSQVYLGQFPSSGTRKSTVYSSRFNGETDWRRQTWQKDWTRLLYLPTKITPFSMTSFLFDLPVLVYYCKYCVERRIKFYEFFQFGITIFYCN